MKRVLLVAALLLVASCMKYADRAAPGRQAAQTTPPDPTALKPAPPIDETVVLTPPTPPDTGDARDGEGRSEPTLQHYGVNPTVDTSTDSVSTFAADVDTGSYTLARAYLERGELPPEA